MYPITASGAADANYTIGYVAGTLTVTPVGLTITANNQTKAYGAALPALTVGYSGFVNGDSAARLTPPPAVTTTGTASSAVGTYPITASGAADANYTIGYVAGTLTVTPVGLTITANNQTKAYGTALPLGSTAFSVGSGLVSGQSVTAVTLAATGGTVAAAAVGSYVITPSAATGTGGFLAANYIITYNSGTLTVNPLAVVLTGSRNYDGTTAAAAAIVSVVNAIGSDVVTVVSGNGTLAAAGVGVRTLTGSGTLALGGAAATNYTLSGASGTVTINAAPLTITANAQSKTYGTTLSLGTTAFSVSGLASEESVTAVNLAANGGTAATDPAGNYVITPSLAAGAGGFLASNYNITYNTASLTVNPAILTVTANNAVRVYGAANPAFTASYAGFANGQTLAASGVTGNPSWTTTATVTSPVPGPYPITPAIGMLAAANYSFSFVGGELTINKANTVAAMNSSANPALPGVSVTLTFTPSPVAPATGTPTGIVNFRIDGSFSGSPALSGGSAALTANLLAHGSHAVIGEYAGDGNFIGSTNIPLAQVIDTPPVAGSLTLYREAASGVQIKIAALLTNVYDADGDPITFVGVSATTTNGGTVSTNTGWIFYTPATGSTNSDAFTYTVSDGYVSVTGIVIVDIQVNADGPSSPNLAIAAQSNGSFLILGDGVPGLTYRIQLSDNLGGTNWQVLGTATANSFGVFRYIDTSSALIRFYRSVYP
jgi:hypothetical protein